MTDENTNGGESFISIDSGVFRAWNANSTAIKLSGPHGDGYWLEFNPSTFKVGDGSSHPVIHPLSFGARWEWSTLDPDMLYFLNANQIAAYNKSTGVTRNLGGPPNGDPVAYFPVVLGQDNWVCSPAGAGVQDSYTKIFCVNPISTGTTKCIDIANRTINGVLQSDPNWPTAAPGQTLGIHEVSGGAGASWLEVTFHGQSWGANGGAVFDLATNTWSLVTNADAYWSGHVAMGRGKYANAAGSVNGGDSRGYVLRNPDKLMNSSEYLFVEHPPDTLNQWCDSEHASWLNSLNNANAPILVSRFIVVPPCQFAWSGEIVAAAVDGSNTVWRFAHNHSTARCYYGEGFAQISNDGNWALFSSFWDGVLGPDTSFGCSTRIDTFIVQLTPPPPSIIAVTVQTNPGGLPITIDGTTYTAPQSFSWLSGSPHTVATSTPQGSGGSRFVFANWSDGGAISHAVAPTVATTYTANFTTQYLLTGSVSPAGSGTIGQSIVRR